MLDRKELGSFLRWWRKDNRHDWIYVYLDWAGDLVFRDIRHGRIIGRIFEKRRQVHSGTQRQAIQA